jgi:hypothetical protein
MAAKGYCTADEVAAFLGKTFTPAQETNCDLLIELAEVEIDEETGRGWLVGPQTDEIYYPSPPGSFWNNVVFLRYTPLLTIEGITGRTGPGEDETGLAADVDYEVRDPAAGTIRLLNGGYERLLLSYTPVDEVPGDIRQATIELVATRIQPQLQPGTFGVDSYSLPDLTVNFSRSHVQAAFPPTVQRVLDRNRYRVQA